VIRALATQSVTYAASTIVARGSQMVTLLVLPMFLTPADYGVVQMIATIAILINLVAPLEIAQGLARYFAESSEIDRRLYSNTAWWFTAAAALLCLIVGLAAQRPLTLLIFGDLQYLDAFRIGAVLIALIPIFYFLQNQCRWQFDAAGYAWISIAFAVATMAASIGLALVITPAVHGVLLGQVLGAVAGVAVAGWRLRRMFVLTLDKAKLKRMIAFSIPLVPAQLALFATLYASRLIINDVATLREVGVFTFASQIAAIASLATLGINAALSPLVMAHHADPSTPPMLARLFEGFTAVAVMICLALGLVAPQLIAFIGNPQYAEAGPLVMILAPAMLLGQMYIFAPGFFIAKRTSQQMLVSIVSGLVCVGANYLFVTRWGITGAAVASLLASATFLLLWLALTQRLYPIPVRWGRVLLGVAGGTMIAAFGSLEIGGSGSLAAIAYKLALTALAAAWCFAVGLLPSPARLWRAGTEQIARLRRRRRGNEA
jgi:O-antigen/teichoic acid export membrane protein